MGGASGTVSPPAPVPGDSWSTAPLARERPVVSTGMAERLAERSAMQRYRRRRRVAIVVSSVAALLAVVWVVLFSPVLGTDPAKVTITGEGTVIDRAEVSAIVAEVEGVPLPRLDTVALRHRILELNGVRDVQILRVWPDGLSVALVSREPVAAVPVGDDGADGYALVDADGVQVAAVPGVPEGLPEVKVPLGSPDGTRVARPLRAALVILNALPPDVRAQVAEVSAATQDAVEMRLRDGATVLWGSAEEVALKVKVFQTLRALPENAAASVYDVSSPTTPITR